MTTNVAAMKAEINEKFDLTSLYECSFDDGGSGEYLIQNRSFPVYNFDEIAREWINKPKLKGCTLLCSPDSLYFTNDNRIFLIEFKNQNYTNVNKIQVRTKLYEFIIMAKEFFGFVDEDIKNISYILVHKDGNSPNTHITRRGRCPKELSVIKKHFSIDVQVYEASIFNTRHTSILR